MSLPKEIRVKRGQVEYFISSCGLGRVAPGCHQQVSTHQAQQQSFLLGFLPISFPLSVRSPFSPLKLRNRLSTVVERSESDLPSSKERCRCRTRRRGKSRTAWRRCWNLALFAFVEGTRRRRPILRIRCEASGVHGVGARIRGTRLFHRRGRRRRRRPPSVSRLRWHVLRRGEDAVRAPDGGRRCGTDNRLRPQDRHGSDGSPPRLPQAEPRPDPSRRQALRARPGTVCDGGTVGSRWHQLPPPPIFPCRLNPLEYRNPPKIRVASYAVVGSHILLSVEAETQQDKGTCAFDMNAKQWEMVDDKNLPFIGQAVSLGSRRFIVRSRAKGGAATVYYMDVFLSRNTNTGKTELSIVEVPVASKGIVPGQLLCSMGKDSFTSFDIQSLDPSPEAKPDRARIVYRTYSMVSGDDGETSSVVKEQRQIFKIRGRFTRLAQPFPVAAVLTMEEESI